MPSSRLKLCAAPAVIQHFLLSPMPPNFVGGNACGLHVLSIDGGGIRGLSALLILREILYRIQQTRRLPEIPRPCDVFDLAGGTNTGGLIVIMLFRLCMSIEDAIKAYTDLAKRVFSEKKWPHQQGTFKASLLEDAILCIIELQLNVEKNEANGVPMLGEEGPKCFVCATRARNMALPTLFRSWKPPDNPTFNCTIVEAARATTANPTLFKAVEIGEENLKEKFVGGLRCNNPVRYVLQEAQSSFPNRPMSCIVSLGTGTANVIGLETPDTFQKLLPTKLLRVLRSMAEDCENTSEELANQSPNMRQIYFRLNVDHGLQDVSLAERDKLADVKTHTMQYLLKHDVSHKVDRLVEILNGHAVEPVIRPPVSAPTRLTPSERQAFDKLEKAIATNAYHDSQARSTFPGCLPGTRKEQIEKIMNWIEAKGAKKPLFVVLGPAGSGKSSLLWTVAQICKDKGFYAAGFFLSSKDLERTTSALFITTIAYQISEAIPELRPYVSRAVEAEGSILSCSLKTQLNSLLLRPLSQLQADHPRFSFRPRIIAIDALDECGNENDQIHAISVLTEALSSPSFPFLCLFSSRFNLHVENLLSHKLTRRLVHDRVELGTNVDAEKDDILAYLYANAQRIRDEHPFRLRIPQDWPAQSDLEAVVERSGGQFIYAATVIRYIESDHKPHDRLRDILHMSSSKSGTKTFAPLDDLYRVLMSSLKDLKTAVEILSIELVSSNAQFWSPVTLEWNGFYEDHFGSLDADMVLAPLASLLKYENRRIKFYHLCFAEFLLDATRSGEFFVHPVKSQTWIVSRLVRYFYDDKGICMADVCNLITEAKADTQLHQVITTGLELVSDHPRCLPGGGDFNIWPFVVETFFWKLRLWISIKNIATVFLQRGKTYLPLPVLIKLAPLYGLGNSFLLFELCRTMAVLENTGFIQEQVCLSLDPDHLLLFMTYLADYLDDQRRQGQNVLMPEDYQSAALRCLWYLQTPRRDIHSSLKEQLHSLEYLPALFGVPRYLKDTSNNITSGALKVLRYLLPQCPLSTDLLASLKQPFNDEVISMDPSSSRRARNLIHKYLMHHGTDYRRGLFEETNNPEEDAYASYFPNSLKMSLVANAVMLGLMMLYFFRRY